MDFRHKNLARGRWRKFSLAEQLGNVGSEVSRALEWRSRDEKLYSGALDRALELFDLTIQDERWLGSGKIKELTRAREIMIDAISGGGEYGGRLEDMDRYFFQFAIIARKRKLSTV